MVQAYSPGLDMLRWLLVQNLLPISSQFPEMLPPSTLKAADGWQMGDPSRFLFLRRIKLKSPLGSLPSDFLRSLLKSQEGAVEAVILTPLLTRILQLC